MDSEFAEIAGCVRRLMRGALAGDANEGEFNRLALELFSLQRSRNAAYGRLCRQRNIGPIHTWRDIAAVPTSAFKQLELTSLPESERTHLFFSSGTTQQDRSRHFHSLESLALYEKSLWLWFAQRFTSEIPNTRWLFLTPTAEQVPNSSLAHMFSAISAKIGASDSEFVGLLERDGGWGLDIPRVLNFLFSSQTARKPVAILGTAFLFVHLLDLLEKGASTVRLPAGSWTMETGGYKGRSREIPKEELHRLIADRLGVAPGKIFAEYGMSELSSQAYDQGDGLFRFPPWARAQIVSPATGREAREGERGLIRIFDLANVWSVMAVQTEDIGIRVGDAFQLMGRAAQAEARGCSLMAA